MFRLVLLAAVLYILFKWLRHSPPPQRKARSFAPPRERQVEEMVKDPYCGTWVPASQALSLNHGKEVLHFCSTECRDKFLSEWKDD